MRRQDAPFNGKQFLLNPHTGEIHDLDHETPDCAIDSINPERIFTCDTYTEAVLFASTFLLEPHPCPHCMKEEQ